MIAEHSLLMDQPVAGCVNSKALKQKEVEEALAVLAQNGIQVPEQ
jgi:hypothetical protein